MAAKDDADLILAFEQRLKFQKQVVQHLHRQLKEYNEAFRHFLSAEKAFYETLDNLCESSWELKAPFSMSLQALSNIAENGVRSLETIPVEETIVFRDQFGPYEKEIQDYKEKQKTSEVAERKHTTYMKKKSMDADELRKLELAAYEKKTSLGILRRKLTDELPSFYQSRMDYYSNFWRSIFQIRADITRAECETLDQLTELVRGFDTSRNQRAFSDSASRTREVYPHCRAQLQGSDSAIVSEAATSQRDDSSADESGTRRRSGGLLAQGIRRVPTYGGSDMASSEDASGRIKPPVPRRSSIRSQDKGKD